MLIIVESIALIMVGLAGGLAVGIGFVAFLYCLRHHSTFNPAFKNCRDDSLL